MVWDEKLSNLPKRALISKATDNRDMWKPETARSIPGKSLLYFWAVMGRAIACDLLNKIQTSLAEDHFDRNVTTRGNVPSIKSGCHCIGVIVPAGMLMSFFA